MSPRLTATVDVLGGSHPREHPEIAYRVRLVEIAGSDSLLRPADRFSRVQLLEQALHAGDALKRFGSQPDALLDLCREVPTTHADRLLDRGHRTTVGANQLLDRAAPSPVIGRWRHRANERVGQCVERRVRIRLSAQCARRHDGRGELVHRQDPVGDRIDRSVDERSDATGLEDGADRVSFARRLVEDRALVRAGQPGPADLDEPGVLARLGHAERGTQNDQQHGPG